MTFYYDWTSEHVPYWDKHLDHLKWQAGVYGLEIGCFEGRSCCWFLENILTHENSRLYCIDCWMIDAQETFLKNTEKHAEKIKLYNEESRFALKRIMETQFFDFVYIDGEHISWGAMRDAVLSLDMLKHDGIMILDDYTLNDKYSYPKPGIDGFLMGIEHRHKLLEKGKQVIIKKKGD